MCELKRPVNVILDTDIGGDCDDACALAVLHALCDRGEAKLLAVTHCYAGAEKAGCIAAVNAYCGHPDIPVGVTGDDVPGAQYGVDVYGTILAKEYPNPCGFPGRAEDSLRVMRRAIANSDGPVTVMAIGSMFTLARLLNSPADDISPLTGLELIREKVPSCVIMGGRFHQSWPQPYVVGDYVVDGEFNIRGDIPAAQVLCDKWPTELVMCSYEIGWDIITGRRMILEGRDDNPMRRAYQIVTGQNGRESWDLATVLYAVRPEGGDYERYPYGRITVDDEGVTRWHADGTARHTYLLPVRTPEEVRQTLDDLLDEVMAAHDQKAAAKALV